MIKQLTVVFFLLFVCFFHLKNLFLNTEVLAISMSGQTESFEILTTCIY